MQDVFSNINILVRWIHVLAGIIWIGFLYFFNFVNLQFQTAIDDATKKAVNGPLILRVLWWFRWAAMVTLIAGLILFTMTYMYAPGIGFGPTQVFQDAMGLTGRATWILLGMLLGLTMWFNVWVFIWPTQKKIFGGKFTAETLPAARKKAAFYSKVNTYLSAPMLFCMLAAPHYGSISFLMVIVVIVIAEALVWHLYKVSVVVGKSV